MRYFMGIDVGGSNIRIVILDSMKDTFVIKESIKFQKDKDVLSEVKKNVIDNIKMVCKKRQIRLNEILGVGVSLAANLDRSTGVIQRWSNHHNWNKFPIYSYLQRHICPDIYIEDDANCGAIGEHYLGNPEGVDDFIYITVSTGVGCGIVVNRSLITGKNGLAGELGHIKAGDPNRVCTCSEAGCLQGNISGPAIKQEIIRRHRVNDIWIDDSKTLENLLTDKSCDESVIRKVFSEAAFTLANVIILLEKLLDIHDFILGGGVSQQEELFYRPLSQILDDEGSSIILHRPQQSHYNCAIGALANTMNLHRQRGLIYENK